MSVVPMEVIHATPDIPLFIRGDKGSATVRTWLDTGGGYAFVTEGLANRLGLTPGPNAPGESASTPYRTVTARELRIGDEVLRLGDVPLAIAQPDMFDRTGAEAFVPSRVLAQHDVVFDYPARTFTIGAPGTGARQGTRVPAPVAAKSRFPRVELTVDGHAHGMLLDTGASHTMISKKLFDSLRTAYPDWLVIDAALGTANMGNRGVDAARQMMRIPEATIGGVTIKNISVVTRALGTYEDYMSPLMSSPIAGALAGNVLQHLRVEIDYAGQEVFLAPASVVIPPTYIAPFSVVVKDGRSRVLNVVSNAAASVNADDELVDIDGQSTHGMPFASVVRALSSSQPGHRALTISRSGHMQKLNVALVEV